MPNSAASARRILHVDVDAMFVQCARFQWPELAGEDLLLVGGRADGRGVVASASYGCRRFGVRSAMPMVQALRLCPRATQVSVPGKMVDQKHQELARHLERWAPVVAMASVDEAYLDLTGCEKLYHDETLEATARRIQHSLREETGLQVSIGGGTNKLIAKVATERAKPAGVYVVAPGQEESFLSTLKPADIPGIGPVWVADLEHRGVNSIAALRALDVATMSWWWGEERARWLWNRIRGRSTEDVAPEEGSKSVSSERTFPRDLYSDDELEGELVALVSEVAQGMRAKGYSARTITVKARDTEFKDRQKARTITEPVRTERAILPIARELLARLRAERRTPLRLLGVSLSSLTEQETPEQTSILEVAPPRESERDRRLAQVADSLRAKFGDQAILPGRILKSDG